MKDSEKIILGIDPGTNVMGYGVIVVCKTQVVSSQFDVVHFKDKDSTHTLKLKKIFESVSSLIQKFMPDEMAIEAPFYGKNVQSMLKLGRAQGVAIAVALSKEIPVFEYAPKKIKLAITGNGNASKEQVASMLKNMLKFNDIPKYLDATDALAVAICHHFQAKQLSRKKKYTDWNSFIKANQNRVKNSI